MISGAVLVDMREPRPDESNWHTRRTPELSERSRVQAAIANAPESARIILMVGSRRPLWDVIPHLREREHRLCIEVHADDPVTVKRWVDAIRLGDRAVMP